MSGKRRSPAPAKRQYKSHVKGESTGKRVIERSRLRLMCIAAFFALSYIAIGIRLIEIGGHFSPSSFAVADTTKPVMEQEAEDSPPPAHILAGKSAEPPSYLRADIVDRNGVLLATSLPTASLYANPREVMGKKEVAKKLAGIIPLDAEKTLRRLSKDSSFVWIKRNLSPGEQQKINTLGIPGLYFEKEARRTYPHGGMTAHLLGYVGVDNNGLAGIEKTFDKRLRGDDAEDEPLVVSLDLRLQNIVYDEIRKGMQEFSAIGATGILADVQTGEILAMANLPTFDPHQPGRAKDEERFNRASLGTYEMGSTFKTFTAAMALDYGKATMKSGYDATRPIQIGGFTISDSHPENRWLSVPEIYAYSSNIGTVHMALDVGTSKQKAFLGKLGMFRPVPIELTEIAQPQYPADWKEINTMTIAYGHGIAVTPLHLIRGIMSVIGNGTLPNLTLVKDGNKDHLSGERVVSEQTVKNMRRLMRLVVLQGTAGKANVAGYHVGGKTGTAEKIVGKGYNVNAKMALFVSAYPIQNPRYALLVMLDEPKPTKATYGFATGGWTSAPVAARIISRMAPLVNLPPESNAPDDDAEKFWVQREGGKKRAADVYAVPRADAVKAIEVSQPHLSPPSSYSNPVPGQFHDIAFGPAR